MVLGFRLYFTKDSTTINTAGATVRQLVNVVYERVNTEDSVKSQGESAIVDLCLGRDFNRYFYLAISIEMLIMAMFERSAFFVLYLLAAIFYIVNRIFVQQQLIINTMYDWGRCLVSRIDTCIIPGCILFKVFCQLRVYYHKLCI